MNLLLKKNTNKFNNKEKILINILSKNKKDKNRLIIKKNNNKSNSRKRNLVAIF